MRLTIGKKLGLSFGVVVLLMAVTYLFGLMASRDVKHAQEEATELSQTATFAVEKVVDHYQWLASLNGTFIENLEHVNVELDPKKCGLGQFLHGDMIQELTASDPEIARIVEAMHPPHDALHATAITIEEHWRARHEGMVHTLMCAREAHGEWARQVAQAIAMRAKTTGVETDPSKCDFGKFLQSEQCRQWMHSFPEFKAAIEATHQPHDALHESGIAINAALAAENYDEASRLLEEQALPNLAKISKHLDAALAAEESILEGQQKARDILNHQTVVHLDKVQGLLKQLQDRLQEKVAQENQASADSLNFMGVLNLTLTVIAIAIAGFAGWWLSRGIVSAVHKLLACFKELEDGNLRARSDIKSNDEFGDLSDGFNKLGDNLTEIIKDVDTAATEVAGAASEIAASSEEMASGMSEQTQQVQQIASAVEEMSASVSEVAQKSREASDKADESGRIAHDGGNTVEETVDGMNNISEAVTSSSVAVQELGKRGEEIGRVIEVINDIADQTNLLALNAAIEAARAGEHGRGFAVVADEVRKLADRTTKATEEVAASIEAIQTETSTAVNKMQKGTEQVESGVVKARQAGESLNQIVGAASDVAALVQSIAAAAEQQSAASTQVAHNVESISAVSSQTSEGAQQAATAAIQLSSKAEELQQLVARFKL